MIFFYIFQGAIHAFFSNKNETGLIINTITIIASSIITSIMLDWTKLWIPFLILFLGGGIIGGYVDAARIKKARRD